MTVKKASIKGLHKKRKKPFPEIERGKWKTRRRKSTKKLIKQWKKEKVDAKKEEDKSKGEV